MKKVIIIAEAGVNHNGDINLAKKLIDIAAESGADYVKFQTFKTELIVDKNAPKAEYQKNNEQENTTQYEMIKKLELSHNDFMLLKKYCDKKRIKFLTTVADLYSFSMIDDFNQDFIKISSGEITNKLFLKKVAQKRKPVIMSTGMANIGEIECALNILTSEGLSINEITVLHCNTEYPTPFEDVNLKAMETISNAFKVKVGYSDHTLGIEIPIAAVAMGAVVIEKHFTIDKNLPGPDHKSSLEPNELKLMVHSIRNIEKALSGNGRKEPSRSEIKNIIVVRKSLFVQNNIKKGEVITEDYIIAKRPGDGVSAMNMDMIIGKRVMTDLKSGHKIEFKDIKW